MIVRRLAITGMLLTPFALAGWAVWSGKPPAPDWSAAYDLTARPPDRIPPGTPVGDGPPPGWSHLVIKSLPRIRPSELGKVNDLTARMTSWMFTAFLADVKTDDDGRHRLRRIGLGLGASVNGRDVVLTPDGAAAVGIKLDFIERSILSRGYEVQQRAMVVLQGPTMAIVDTPVWFRCRGKNKLVRFRYALLIDAASGRLDTLAWGLDTGDGGCFSASRTAVKLAPNTVAVAELVPDMNEFKLGLPTDSAFGVDSLMPGTGTLAIPSEIESLTKAMRFSPEDARTFENGLRQMVAISTPLPGHSP